MNFVIKEYVEYKEDEILNLYEYPYSTGISTKGNRFGSFKKLLFLYKDVYQKVLLTDDTEKTVQFYQAAGFKADSDIGCRAFLKI